MNPEPLLASRSPSDLQAQAAFQDWVRRLVTGAAELRAFEAGQIDAILDPASGRAILLPEAQARISNHLLAALPVTVYERLCAGLEPIELTYGEVLYEPGAPMRYVYFPGDCLVSLLTVVESRRALEVALVGREGMVGHRLALGFRASAVRALVQRSGTAMRMKSKRFLREFRRSPALRRALFRFTDALMIQVSQTAACNRFHLVEARLARWLLMTRERLSSDEFYLTHEFLAEMLGIRRSSVTLAAGALQRRKLIHYRRGNLTIVDRQGLEAASCFCYRDAQSLGPAAAT